MSSWEVLVNESPSIDWEASLTSRIADITSLNDEPVDNSMEFGIEVMKFCVICFSVLPCTDSSEIFWCFRCQIIEQLKDYSACSWCSDLNIHVHFKVCFWTHFRRYFIIDVRMDCYLYFLIPILTITSNSWSWKI